MTSERETHWSSTRVDGSSANILSGLGQTKNNLVGADIGWFAGDSTIIIDGLDMETGQKLHHVIATWEIPVDPKIIDRALHGFLVITCLRQFGGLHTEEKGQSVSIYLNEQQIDLFGLEVIPEGHTDYFHRQNRQLDPHWLSSLDPFLASCMTIYHWPIFDVHLVSPQAQIVKVVLESQAYWDIDYVALLLCQSQSQESGVEPVADVLENADDSRSSRHDFDVFVCYASEDRATIESLVAVLKGRGIKVWWDRGQITLGDRLSEKIDEGLRNSRYGVMIISKSSIAKPWPEAEFHSVIHRSISSRGEKVLLPVLLDLTHAQFAEEYPLLADIVTAQLIDADFDQLADEILTGMGRDPHSPNLNG